MRRIIILALITALLASCNGGITGNTVKETVQNTCGHEEPVLIKGQSMEPTLHDGERATALLGYYDCHEPARGDIVLFKTPEGLGVKRIAAIPDNTWEVKKRRLFINGKLAEKNGKPYAITPKMKRTLKEYAHFNPLPAGHYFLLADYTGNALDSRRIGIIAKSDIVGKVITNEGDEK